jgi:hypothetical protein
MSDRRQAASFRDPSGFLFERDGELYRQVNRRYQDAYDRLMESGLYRSLVERGWLIPHEEVDVPPAAPDLSYRVIQPEHVPFISYPYEWCFGQLKAAALLTLDIQLLSLEHGMSLKDSSAYNIQFLGSRPLLIDTLSFEPWEEGEPWVAYRQFCQHFLAPLALMAYVDPRLSGLLRAHIDGLPLDMAVRLLPRRARLRPGLLMHLVLHARAQRKAAAAESKEALRGGRRVSRQGLLGVIESLRGTVRGLKLARESDTPWEGYYEFHSYSKEAFAHKEAVVAAWLEAINPQEVWDLGANVGHFSRLAARTGCRVISMDSDPGVVERNYRQACETPELWILPLLMDLANPSPGLGWCHEERMPLLKRGPADVLLALAIIHHLAIGNNVPLDKLAAFFAGLGRRLIVEFVPKEDAQVKKLLAFREDIFSDYHEEGFREAFERHFTIQRRQPIKDSARVLYEMQCKS